MSTIASGNPAPLGLVTQTLVAISGAADNGGGLVRITAGAVHGLTSGDEFVVAGVVGTTEANGRWVAIVISTTVVDLTGSTFANAYVSDGLLGVPSTFTKNFPDMEISLAGTGQLPFSVKSLFVQARNSNTDKVYIGKQLIDKVTGDDVLAELNPGEFWSLNMNDAPNAFGLADFRLDADVNGEGGYVSFTIQ